MGMARNLMISETLETLLDQAARARRFAVMIRGDPAARRLEQLADELDAEIARYAGELATHPSRRPENRFRRLQVEKCAIDQDQGRLMVRSDRIFESSGGDVPADGRSGIHKG
jgi:hypothetical protein